MKPELDRPNWVYERGRCTLESKFIELLDTVKFDIREANKVLSPARHGQLFSVEECTREKFRVRRYPECKRRDDSGFVTFELKRDSLVVHLPGERHFDIVPRWNEVELRCDLVVDGKSLDLWQITQKALGNFIFEDDS